MSDYICERCIHDEVCGKIAYYPDCSDFLESVKCEDCKHSIKKDYSGVILYEYLCTLKSTVTHIEEHEADYFCADGKRRENK